MNEKNFATKFLRDEAQIKQDWLCLLMKDDNAPLDVTYKANLQKIQREYYPIACFDVTCEAEWSATSYWEHEEKYQVAREETVYIDYQGNEHSSNGTDTEIKNGHVYTRHRKPMSRTVYDTKKKTVVDNVQQTSGFVNSTIFTERVFTGNSNCGTSIMSWIHHFSKPQLVSVDQEYLKDFTVIQESVSRLSAQLTAENMARNDIGNVASKNVPGTRYEGLSVTSNILEVERETVYVGVYHIFYEYEGKNYQCLMCGGDKVEDVILGEHPVDDAIKAHSDAFQEEIKKNSFFSRKTLYLLGAIVISFISLITIPMLFMFGSVSNADRYSGFSIITNIIITLILLGADAFCINKFIVMHKRKQRAETEKANFNESNAFLKKQIYDLVQNDSIPEEGKKEIIEGRIKAQFGNFDNADSLRSQVDAEGKAKTKKIMILAGVGVVALLVVASLLFIVLPEARYNAAIKKIDNNELVEGVAALKKMANYKDASEYLKKYGSPIPGIDEDVFLRGLELVNVFKSEEFIDEFGRNEKEQLDKEYDENYAGVTLKEYVESLTDSDSFKDYLDKIEKIKAKSDYDERYLEAVKGYFYVACDYAIAQEIENSTATKYYRFELENHSWGREEDLGKLLDELYDDFYSSGAASLSTGYRVIKYGSITIVGAKYTPDERIDMSTIKYFGEAKEETSSGKNNTENNLAGKTATEGYSLIGFEGLSFELPKDISFADEGDGRGSFDYLSGSGCVVFIAYDSSEYNINADNVETYYDKVISANIQAYNPRDMQANGTVLDGCVAKFVQCKLYMENGWRPSVVLAVCNRDYSRLYVITNIVFDVNLYTDEDGSVYEHVIDTIDLP